MLKGNTKKFKVGTLVILTAIFPCTLISKIFNIGYAGIDIKTHKSENFILEINSIPSWKGLQSVDERNITKLLVKDFLDIIEKKNGKRKKY